MDELPVEIIQNIQSFLQTKEAAGTIILSKSWLRAWSTRPFLDFYMTDFSRKNYDPSLIKLIDTTLRTYMQQGLTILKLRLHLDTIQERWLQMVRRSNVIALDLYSVEIWEPTFWFWPLIFMTNSLQSLKVDSLWRPLVLSHTDIKCRNLNTLDLSCVDIDYLTFLTIMTYCPLIEKLLLRKCKLVNCSNSGDFAGGEFASLKTTSLIQTSINDEQLQTILSKSPKLEDMNLIHCFELVKAPIHLSSASLKCVKIVIPVQIIRIDVPNLHRLEYLLHFHRTSAFPITTPATKGEVNVDIVYHDRDIDASWFHGLREFLAKFAKSNVKFTFYYLCRVPFAFKVRTPTPPSSRHEVETLKFVERFTNLPILYAFFTICHPKIVLLEYLSNQCAFLKEHAFLKELYKDLSYRGDLECCKINRSKCWRHYIKDAKLYYTVKNEQKLLDMNGLDMVLENVEVITLSLEWKSSD